MSEARPSWSAARPRPALIVALVLLLVVVLAGAYLASSYEVIDKGRFFSYSEGTIYKLDVGGATVYAEKEVTPTLDVLNAFLLLAIASVSAFSALILWRLGRERRLQAFFGLAAVGAFYLGVDELLGVHESIGHNLRFLADLPGVDQPDAVVQAFYAIPACIFLFYFRREMLVSREAKWAFLAGLALLLVAYAGDGRPFLDTTQEDTLEVLASFAFVGAFVLMALHHIAGVVSSRPRPT